jgi:UDP-N-acetylglucosamine acyltransferase
MPVHPTAPVSAEARIHESAAIGPYAVIEGEVEIGKDCIVGPHAVLQGPLEIESDTTIGPSAVLGAPPQDLTWAPSQPGGVRIGWGNRIREFVTIHRSTHPEPTSIGNGNFLMGGVHVGHDAKVGDGNVVANNCLIGGHVLIGNRCFVGGGAVFHQFVRVGDHCMIQGIAGFSLDVPPFLIGCEVNRIAGVNSVGLRRAGISHEARREIKELYELFYRSHYSRTQALEASNGRAWNQHGQEFLAFMRYPSRKGICLRPEHGSPA